MGQLLLILQRYYFESESQQNMGVNYVDNGCCLSYKDTILKANHSKLLKLLLLMQLLLILQRYYFESESQHPFIGNPDLSGCCLSYKDTILKANHSTKRIEEL